MTLKQKWALIFAGAFMALCFIGLAHAQTPQPVTKNITLSWVLPTKYTDGTALPVADITKVQVYLANAEIPDTFTGPPTVELTPATTTVSRTHQAWTGGTIHARVRACTASACSDLSVAAKLLVPIPPPLKPGIPTEVRLILVVPVE